MKRSLSISGFIALLLVYGCHSKNELGLNEKASINSLGDLPENPLLLNAITSSVYPKDSTLAVLYGNDIAYHHGKVSNDGNYPIGAVLYEVTWQLQEDEQWFGANIPKVIKSIERIEISKDNMPQYTLFEGFELNNSKHPDETTRIKWITNLRMAVSP
ncbi:hypothetical protein [Parapedobacter koreensis]|uniref:Cytochrome P460 n=1 Tax=Parapedobacter koreensis TaxID=332977 RepID=A0A1H7JZ74_9SPHI|nr:hypothetical protein [Parapedobacter koreensis]SEK79674.1 hypothetical protein SAMN05421740_102722 [Parapedobacter koreensis]